ALVLVSPEATTLGEAVDTYPPTDRPLHFDRFFANIYQQYDLRFVYGAPNLARKTRRLAWDPSSPALSHECAVGLQSRIASTTGMRADLDEASDEAAGASPYTEETDE